MKTVLAVALLLGLAAPARAQPPVIYAFPGSKLQFDIVAPDLATANAYVWRTYVDAAAVGTVIPLVVCTGTIVPFTCIVPFPTQTVGVHTLAMTAANATAEGPKSTPLLTFTWTLTPPPNAPTTIRIASILDLFPQHTTLGLDAVNHSGDAALTVTTWPAHMVGGVVVLKFTLPPFPTTTVVRAATLVLTLTAADNAGAAYAVPVYKLLRAVDPATATGYNRIDVPGSSDGPIPWTPNGCCAYAVPMAQADLSPAYGSTPVATRGAATWNLTTMVQEWVRDPASNFGLVLNPDVTRNADRFRSFASLASADMRAWPYLRVVVEVA